MTELKLKYSNTFIDVDEADDFETRKTRSLSPTPERGLGRNEWCEQELGLNPSENYG